MKRSSGVRESADPDGVVSILGGGFGGRETRSSSIFLDFSRFSPLLLASFFSEIKFSANFSKIFMNFAKFTKEKLRNFAKTNNQEKFAFFFGNLQKNPDLFSEKSGFLLIMRLQKCVYQKEHTKC